MGAGGRDNEKEAPADTPLPPAYQEKEPLPTDNPESVVVQTPTIVQGHRQCRKRKHKRCCCYCCTILVVLIICCTVLPLGIVFMTKGMWNQPYVQMYFEGKSSQMTAHSVQTGQGIVLTCHVDMKSQYLPLVQWFHDPNEASEDGNSGFKMFAVHNTIEDEAYKGRFEVIKTETQHHRIIYSMEIKNALPQDSGRYACQVPEASRHNGGFTDEYQEASRSRSSSDSSEDDERHKRKKHHGGCSWFKHRRNDYLEVTVTK